MRGAVPPEDPRSGATPSFLPYRKKSPPDALRVRGGSRSEVGPDVPDREGRGRPALEDPADAGGDFETRVAAFRKVRDEIKQYFEAEFIQLISE